MEFVPFPNIVQAELITTYMGSMANTVLHYAAATPWSTDEAAELGAQMVAKWNTALKPLMSSQVILVNIKFTDLSDQFSWAINYATGLPIQGTKSGTALPSNVAIVLTKRTLLRGRAHRGRIYHYGLVSTDVSNNSMITTSLTAILAAWNQFKFFTLTTGDVNMVVASRFLDKVQRPQGVGTLVDSLTSDGLLDSQRRRLSGRGA
jgi:hypothetical protein